jgi:serine/threonine protein kinase
MSHKSGDFLGRYQLLCPIAAGGMATVWAARVQGAGSFQKPVALKLMLPHLARDDRFVTMFMDEAMLAANIQSPHVVGTYDLGHDDETLYMAMELVLGMTLRDLLMSATDAKKEIPIDVALSLIVQMARGLTDAHEAKGATGDPLGIIHRDVSPHNVLLGLDGRARLSDFGIARAVQRQSRTETGEVKGKLSYFAPEQLKADDLDQRVDVFALGIVAWEALAGRRLFEGDNPLQLAFRIANDPIPRVDAARPDVPARIADVIEHALTRDREKRCQTARAFVDALQVAAQSGTSTGLASETAVAAVLREHAGGKVENLERRVRELMALPSDAAPESFRSGQTGRQTAQSGRTPAGRSGTPASSQSMAISQPMPGLPAEAMPISRRPPAPRYGRIAAVALVVVGLLTGTAWVTVRAFTGEATPELSPPITAIAPARPDAIEVGAPPSTATPEPPPGLDAPEPTAAEPIATPEPTRTGRRPGPRGSTSPRTSPDTATSPTTPSTTTSRTPPSTTAPVPEPRPTTTPSTPSIVADQDEFCRAMGTCD